MQLRITRHTNSLSAVKYFYVKLLGLNILGDFKDHEGYNGIFIGKPEQSWHLEFTTSEEPAHHHPDPNDLLVIYFDEAKSYQEAKDRCIDAGLKAITPRNPYWYDKGAQFNDPDGYGVMLCTHEPFARNRGNVE